MKKITDYAELVKAKHALNKTIAPVEDGANMAGSYTTGQQFIRDGVLYTALTRARELLVIVGDSEIIHTMTMNQRREKRYSGLRERLAELAL